MKKLYTLSLALLFSFQLSAQDTFSIIAVDPDTGDVGSAGASCIGQLGGLVDIITDIIPGKGGVNSQAFVCIPNSNLEQAIEQMENGATPDEIINFLVANDNCGSQNFNPAFRQYGIADLDGNGDPRTAGWTGDMADDYKEDRQGSNYSIQGNILLNVTVIDNMEDNFNAATGTLADKLMFALQGANFPGADSRCLNAGTSSTSAYIIVYHEDDLPGEPYLKLSADQLPSGTEPIDVLQGLYDQTLSGADFQLADAIQLVRNPVQNEVELRINPGIELSQVSIVDIQGKEIVTHTNFIPSTNAHSFDVANISEGVYFLRIQTNLGSLSLKFVKN